MRQCCSKMTSQKFSQNIFVPQGLLLSQAIEIANSTFSEICFANTLKLCEAAYVGFPSLSAVQATLGKPFATAQLITAISTLLVEADAHKAREG
jgi:hypothetical protein